MTVRNLDALFRASSVLVLGAAGNAVQRRLLANLERSVPPAMRTHLTTKVAEPEWPGAEVAVLLHPDWADPASITALGAQGCKALLWCIDTPPALAVLQAAKPYVMRLLGPHSAGLIHSGHGLNLSGLPQMPRPGPVALIGQSSSPIPALLEGLRARDIGVSWLAATGDEADVDAADLLDYSALDPQTRAVLLQLGHIGQARKFMSAARAAARLKPVLVLQTGVCDPVRSAAFQRAGLVECATPEDVLDVLSALLPESPVDRAAPTDAVLRYRAHYRNTRELLRQTPPPDATMNVDSAGVARALQHFRAQGRLKLSSSETSRIFAEYGYAIAASARRPAMRIDASRHAEIGMVLSVHREPVSGGITAGYGLPPLDELLARHMLDVAGCVSGIAPQAAALIRIGQLLIDQPLVLGLHAVMVCSADEKRVALADCGIQISVSDPPERQRIALAPYPVALAHEARLRGERRYRVRAVRPADEPAVLRLLARLNPEEIRLRFFAYIRHFSHDMAVRVTQVDYDRELTLVASAIDEPGEIAAMATLVADADGHEAEYAVLVHHDHVRRGLGRHLLENLLKIARERGIGKVVGDVLADNAPMLGLVRSLGFEVVAVPDDPGCRRVEIKP